MFLVDKVHNPFVNLSQSVPFQADLVFVIRLDAMSVGLQFEICSDLKSKITFCLLSDFY